MAMFLNPIPPYQVFPLRAQDQTKGAYWRAWINTLVVARCLQVWGGGGGGIMWCKFWVGHHLCCGCRVSAWGDIRQSSWVLCGASCGSSVDLVHPVRSCLAGWLAQSMWLVVMVWVRQQNRPQISCFSHCLQYQPEDCVHWRLNLNWPFSNFLSCFKLPNICLPWWP